MSFYKYPYINRFYKINNYRTQYGIQTDITNNENSDISSTENSDISTSENNSNENSDISNNENTSIENKIDSKNTYFRYPKNNIVCQEPDIISYANENPIG